MHDAPETNDYSHYDVHQAIESTSSGVSWPAVFAGAVTAVAISILLAVLGSGLGFASTTITEEGASAKTISIMFVIWLILMQWASLSVGGYITGRLRRKWVSLHNHEVFFRDTAHGLLAWSFATIVMVVLFASATATALNTSAYIAAPALYGMTSNSSNDASTSGWDDSVSDPLAYAVDNLMRPVNAGTATSLDSETRAQVHRTLLKGFSEEALPEGDRTYLVQIVTARTGLPEAEASKRVDDTLAQEKTLKTTLAENAETARKTVATLSIFTALSLLVGAFIACVSAALGGRLRDSC